MISLRCQAIDWTLYSAIGQGDTASASTRNGVYALTGHWLRRVRHGSRSWIITEGAKGAHQLNGPQDHIDQIINGERNIVGDTALRLGHWFGNSAEFWLYLQTAYGLKLAHQAAGEEIAALPGMPELVEASGAKPDG